MKSVGSLEEAPTIFPSSKKSFFSIPPRLKDTTPVLVAAASHCNRSGSGIVRMFPDRLMRGKFRGRRTRIQEVRVRIVHGLQPTAPEARGARWSCAFG